MSVTYTTRLMIAVDYLPAPDLNLDLDGIEQTKENR